MHEETLQIKVSPTLKREIRRSAFERDETVRTFILRALKSQGISVADEELVDRRKGADR